ncbi:haloperoxidase PAP2-like protein [Fadolivirus algeromassiliense]|jgi:hypothetical protein|uniref:Haloperoxidase PAP2-like protein n=1 Tax=Fadolivirus FV1/VV64 TaxID=3070911 RepID=A0A7D3V955_9VIRU|nr:haloperoxidase PAP2-like protein [Fadolivirus algeromassiliense]QKF94637.1 haloperoxidase PAP2-like protein [Fadolivirus FV1/VV64]
MSKVTRKEGKSIKNEKHSKPQHNCDPCNESESSTTVHHNPCHPCHPVPQSHCDSCINRNFQNKSEKLRCKLGKLQKHECPPKPAENAEELKYKNYNYNGLFHKGLQHDSNGTLLNPLEYEKMRDAILSNDQVKLATVQLATGSQMKLVNPLASLATMLVGAPQCALKIANPPTLHDDAGAADMVEVYAHVVARDVEFRNYGTDAAIANLLLPTHMNEPSVLANMRNKPILSGGQFTAKNLFRGISSDELIGPYISQFVYLDVPIGIGKVPQAYTVPLARYASRVEWGVTKTEAVNMQNGLISSQPGTLAADPTKRYIYTGRALAELVHNDPAFHIYYAAALILGGLGASPNPSFPVYPNQASFITGAGGPGVQCALAEVTGMALKHAWYWKWQCFRGIRPEGFALAIDNVKTGTIANPGNYDISNVVLNNGVLPDIVAINNAWVPGNSHTLAVCYKEGSPTHPTYTSGHATIAGAACTILKIFYDCDKAWASLPGVQTGVLSSLIPGPVEPAAGGATLVAYTGADAGGMSIWGEINKLASNISIGRNWAGVHYRQDAIEGMLLGEQIAIKYMEDCLSGMVENNLNGTFPQITFRKFDGTHTTIKPTLCKGRC